MAYRIYGIDLDSDARLDGIRDAPGPAQWRFVLAEELSHGDGVVIRAADEPGNDDLVEIRWVPPERFTFVFGDGLRLAVDGAARTISEAWPRTLSFEDGLVCLVGPGLGTALRLERRSVLHASAVDVGGRALLVMGEGGAGKSTLTAAFLDAGHRLVTEDVTAITFDDEGVPGVFRGGSRVKLWDDSVVGLRGHADALPALIPTNLDWTKKFLDGSAQMTARDVTPIASIVLLDRDDACRTPRLEELPPQERVLVLVANGYATRLVLPDDRADELARLSALARAVPVRRLVYPSDMTRLPEVVEFLARSC